MSIEEELENFRKEYKDMTKKASDFSDELVNQLDILIRDNEINLGFPIQKRVKSWESIEEKLKRVQLNRRSLKSLQDLIGVRLVVLFAHEASDICKIITETLSVQNRYDTQERLSEDQFGYSSTHLIVNLPDEWLSLPSFKGMEEFIAEIQIRTLSQHIWAEVSHTLQYKQEDNVPSEILRSIYRASALLETVDLEFERVLNQRNEYRKSINSKNKTLDLNVDLIEEILDSKIGAKRKSKHEPYSELLSDLRHFGITSSKSFKTLLEDYYEESLKIDIQRVDTELKNLKEGKSVLMEDPDKLHEGVFFTQVGLVRMMLRKKYGAKGYSKLARNSK